jgi:predicted restriction endonuclease
MIKVPEDRKEYLAIYTTEYDDTFLLEPIVSSEIMALRQIVAGKTERNFEADFDSEITDEKASLSTQLQIVKIRKLNRKIGENLKLLYGYRCQICGRLIGEEYGSHIAEAHHIDYFVNSLNNDANNQMILCPNHHSIIHDVNPVFDRKRLIYIYKNGLEEKLMLNQHL